MKRTIIYVFLLTAVSLFAQTKITPSEYKNSFDSLTAKKAKLLSAKLIFKNKIDSLNKLNAELDKKLEDCLPSYFVKKYGRDIGGRIALGRVWKGMTEGMLRDSYGKPDKVKRNKEKWGTFAQYYYGEIVFFFRDGKLMEWEENK